MLGSLETANKWAAKWATPVGNWGTLIGLVVGLLVGGFGAFQYLITARAMIVGYAEKVDRHDMEVTKLLAESDKMRFELDQLRKSLTNPSTATKVEGAISGIRQGKRSEYVSLCPDGAYPVGVQAGQHEVTDYLISVRVICGRLNVEGQLR